MTAARSDLDELRVLIDEYDPALSDWLFRRGVIHSVIDRIAASQPKPYGYLYEHRNMNSRVFCLAKNRHNEYFRNDPWTETPLYAAPVRPDREAVARCLREVVPFETKMIEGRIYVTLEELQRIMTAKETAVLALLPVQVQK